MNQSSACSSLLPVCVLLASASLATAQEAAARAVRAYQHLYDGLAELGDSGAAPPKYSADEFLPNWAVRAPGEEKIRIAFSPDGPQAGVRVHRSEVLIQLRPEADPRQLASYRDFLAKQQISVQRTIPEIGLIIGKVSDDAQPAIDLPKSAIEAVKQDDLAGLQRVVTITELLERIREQPWVAAATPNTYISMSVIPVTSQGQGKDGYGTTHFWDWRTGAGSPAARNVDGNWGLKRMGFPAAWNFNDAIRRRSPAGQVHVGVLDDGFTQHVDLGFANAPVAPPGGGDHGMHVAGIIAATWNGAVGIEGCTPFAKLTTAATQHGPFAGVHEGQPPQLVVVDVVATLIKMISVHPDMRVLNISAGYNWVEREGLDPNSDPDVQRQVKEMGTIVRTIAEMARERDMIIVSSAGNDSRPGRLARPVEAQWGSPFNWAALNKGIFATPAFNIIVVESVARSAGPGDRASDFSNVHGCLAAPGEDILSLVATSNPFRQRAAPAPSKTTYAVMSGTSMAAPHVTGLIALMYAYNPQLKSQDVLRILDVEHNNRPATTTPAPVINAFDALVACRDTALHDLADLNGDDKVDRSDFDIFKAHWDQVSGKGGNADLNGDGQVNGDENYYPRCDLNGSGQLSLTETRLVKGKMLTDLGVMQEAWQDAGVRAAELDGMLGP